MPSLKSELSLNAEVHELCMVEGGYPERWPRHETCPCCNRAELKVLFSKYGFKHDQCKNCGFVCLNPYPSNEILSRLYAGAYYTNFREYYEAKHIREIGGQSMTAAPMDMLEAMVERAAPPTFRGDWLDVGGGLGTVANFIRIRRPSWRVSLNEFNPRSLELAKELYDLDVISSDPGQLLDQSRRFDVISAIMVLEHIPRPAGFLESYSKLLKPGGLLVLIIPQFTYLNAAVSKASSANAAPPFHVSLFNESNLRRLLEAVPGMGKVAIEQNGPPAFSLMHHYDYSDYWDIITPTAENPVPRAIMVKDYPTEVSLGINALAEADKALGDHFAETDGRLYLTAFAQRQPD